MNAGKKAVICLVLMLVICISLMMPVYAGTVEARPVGWGIVGGFWDALKSLFIPKTEYFTAFRADITNGFEDKFSGLTSAIGYLNNRFNSLREYRNLPGIFKVTFPNNSFLKGISIDFLSVAAPVLSFIRLAVTGFCCLFTALICYHRALKIINT